MDNWAKNNSGVKIIITKKNASDREKIKELLTTDIYNIQLEVSFKTSVAINLSNTRRYFIVQS